jgi:RNA polymerase sigma factor (sigma-70 family)
MNKVIQHIHRIALLQAAGERTDGQLLECFVRRRETAALEALVHRHGPMVWGVCRRILHDHHDAEDAFQATFLVLVRKAALVKPTEMVGNWLYGVAHQTALKARATRAKRRTRERQVAAMPEPAVTQQDLWRDLQPVLDQELSRLPDKYRVAIVLCDLEGKTRKEAARQLGCPEGTVAGRLARARIMLAKRLTRRGVVLSGGALAAVLSQQAASAAVPTSVVVSTIKAASLLAAGKAAATGAISVKVAALTEGVMKAMLLTELKTVLAVVLVLGFVATGATVLTSRTAAGQEDKPALAEKPVATSAKQEPEKKEEFAWGKEVNGLQLGLALVPADKIAYRLGEQIKFEVRVRNVSNAAITISYGRPESEPEITDAKGEKVHVAMPAILDIIVIPTEQVLKPGETVALYQREVAVERVLEGKADPNAEVGIPTIRVPPGKYRIAFDEFVQSDLILSTGGVEFEAKDKNDKESPEKKEAFTSWGKEVKGLQLGLARVPADKIAYHPGEEIKFEVKVRNVSKAPITISYGRLNESPPEISDAQGGKVHVAMPPIAFYFAVPTEKILKPGETVALYKPEVAVEEILEGKADAPTAVQTPTIRLRSGKYRIAFGGMVHSHPTLSTGAVEFEVTDKNSKAKDGARASLSDAIKALNTKALHNPIGKDETPITEPEVIAAIRAAKRPEDSVVTDKLFDAFKKIAETKQLPPGAELQAVGGVWDPGTEFVYDVWWVRLQMPKEANGTYSFVIRERFIRSRTLQEEIDQLEPKPGEEQPVDGGRTQERINDLKALIEKMKAK